MLKKIKHMKVPKSVGWLIPGLEVKRWFVLILAGSSLILLGLLTLLNVGILSWLLGLLKTTLTYVPSDLFAGVMMAIGAG